MAVYRCISPAWRAEVNVLRVVLLRVAGWWPVNFRRQHGLVRNEWLSCLTSL